ncbi:type II secretion system F family protein [Streptomyces sp. NPDC050145]|uniref:type II secretion system F family protein n=1 Tax=Streptomyces sp. NPDC050145 TaxID=3365602 RepID=UPI003789C35F
MSGVVAVALLGVLSVAWAVRVRGGELRRARAVLGPGPEVGGAAPVVRWPGLVRCRAWLGARPEWACGAAGLAVGVLGASPLPLVLGAAAVPGAARVRRARDARRAAERRGDAVIRLCELLAGEVRAGRQPGAALTVAVRESGAPGGAAVVAAARFGGDVPGALGSAAAEPGAEGLYGLAACWRVAVDRGAGLAVGVDRLADALRAERDQRAELRAQLAGPWSTSVMLAGLPVCGLLLGSLLGARPLRVLLHTGPGLGCLVVGGLLEAAGLWWAVRIVRGAERG